LDANSIRRLVGDGCSGSGGCCHGDDEDAIVRQLTKTTSY